MVNVRRVGRHDRRPAPARPAVTRLSREPVFRTPEAVAAAEASSSREVNVSKKSSKLKTLKSRLIHWRPTRKQAIIGGIVLAGLVALYWGLVANKKEAPPAPAPVVEQKKEEAPPKPTTEPSRLTGVQVPIALNQLPVTGVMIENSPEARPQAGLEGAGVVFEAIAEGGITRFLALYQEGQPASIGPVRSIRYYYLDWLVPFDAALAHVGGSADALAQIRNEGIKDLDQSFNSGSYTRVSSRFAPHNVYTSRERLVALQRAKGFTASNYTGFGRKEDNPSKTPTARSIDLTISRALYNPHYDYDAATNSYKRSQAGQPHVVEGGAQLNPKVVMVLVITHGIAPDGLHSTYNTTGNGKLYVFQDGVVVEGSWEKAGRASQFRFTDAAGNALPLNRGQTWISVVSQPGSVSFKP